MTRRRTLGDRRVSEDELIATREGVDGEYEPAQLGALAAHRVLATRTAGRRAQWLVGRSRGRLLTGRAARPRLQLLLPRTGGNLRPSLLFLSRAPSSPVCERHVCPPWISLAWTSCQVRPRRHAVLRTRLTYRRVALGPPVQVP